MLDMAYSDVENPETSECIEMDSSADMGVPRRPLCDAVSLTRYSAPKSHTVKVPIQLRETRSMWVPI